MRSARIPLRKRVLARLGIVVLAVFFGASAGSADQGPVIEQSARDDESPSASRQGTPTSTNFQVTKIGDEDSRRYKISSDLTNQWSFAPEPFEEDLQTRRKRLEEKARTEKLLEMMVEDIRRAKRERAAAQQRELILEVEDSPEP